MAIAREYGAFGKKVALEYLLLHTLLKICVTVYKVEVEASETFSSHGGFFVH